MLAEGNVDGRWNTPRCIAGDLSEESLQQPRFDEHNRLYCLTDRAGFWQPWAQFADGLIPAPSADADHAPAPWQLGTSTWLPLGEKAYLASWTVGGFARLGIHTPDGHLEDYTGDYSRFRCLALDDEFIYCIAASPVSPSAVIAIRRRDKQVSVLAGALHRFPPSRSAAHIPCATPPVAAKPMAFSTRRCTAKPNRHWWCLFTVARHRPATRCSTRAFNTGRSAVLPLPTSTIGVALATVATIVRPCI
jgi:hypothetical protein